MGKQTTQPQSGHSHSFEEVNDLQRQISGSLITVGDSGYDEARRVWNGMIDRHPVAVVRAAEIADIGPVVQFARTRGLPLAVRGGGHNVAGNGTADGGLVLDLGRLTAVEVDGRTNTVRAQRGATLADLERATEPYGLAVPVGVVSGTGVAGRTLGGGVGWLTRAHGLTDFGGPRRPMPRWSNRPAGPPGSRPLKIPSPGACAGTGRTAPSTGSTTT